MKFQNRVRVRIISADPIHTLELINRHTGIYDVRLEDDAMTCSFSLPENYIAVARDIAVKRGDSFQLVHRKTMTVLLKKLLRRPLLLLGLATVFALTLFLPSRILFFRVEGNDVLSSNSVLYSATQCGMYFGMSRRDLRSEKMKNALLQSQPQLQWVGINTSGCVATITVRERKTDGEETKSAGVSSIIALRDGVIREITVEKGNGVCKVGQAVKAGQVLISGYTDCGLTVRATRAQGEIYAATLRSLTVISPTQYRQREQRTGEVRKISFILGKKRINFYKGSGISASSCVKMYSEYYLTLPGGFSLPIGIVTETWTEHSAEETVSTATGALFLEDFARSYLQQQMIAGQILSSDHIVETEDGYLCLYGKYACDEMIAAVRNEEILDNHGN